MTADQRIYAGSDCRKPLPDKCSASGCDRKPRTRLDNLPVCGTHEYRYRRYRSFSLPARMPVQWRTCNVSGCGAKSRTRKGALCEKHYYRRYRTGTFNDPEYKRRYLSHGYIRLVGADCPIAGEGGTVFEHRKVLYDAIGPGSHPCHWCGSSVVWKRSPIKAAGNALVVDHLNSKKHDNRVSNLVPSCQRCNAARGLFVSWVLQHQDDPFLRQLFEQANAQTKG